MGPKFQGNDLLRTPDIRAGRGRSHKLHSHGKPRAADCSGPPGSPGRSHRARLAARGPAPRRAAPGWPGTPAPGPAGAGSGGAWSSGGRVRRRPRHPAGQETAPRGLGVAAPQQLTAVATRLDRSGRPCGSGQPTFSNADSIPSDTTTAARRPAQHVGFVRSPGSPGGLGGVTVWSRPSRPAIRPATTTSGWPANPWVRARNGTRAAVSAAATSLESFPPVSESSTGAFASLSGRTASARAAATGPAPRAALPPGTPGPRRAARRTAAEPGLRRERGRRGTASPRRPGSQG